MCEYIQWHVLYCPLKCLIKQNLIFQLLKILVFNDVHSISCFVKFANSALIMNSMLLLFINSKFYIIKRNILLKKLIIAKL